MSEHAQAPASPTRHLGAPAIEPPADDGDHIVGTRDHALIRACANHHDAAPATGEAISGGQATVVANAQGTGLRVNLPAAGRFRPVEREEWLAHFEPARLVFVYELGQALCNSPVSRFGGGFYRLVGAGKWGDRPLATISQ